MKGKYEPGRPPREKAGRNRPHPGKDRGAQPTVSDVPLPHLFRVSREAVLRRLSVPVSVSTSDALFYATHSTTYSKLIENAKPRRTTGAALAWRAPFFSVDANRSSAGV